MSKKPPKPPGPPDGPNDWRRRLSAALRTDWRSIAREEQISPPGDWTTWIFCAGRGAGKTRSGAEWIQGRVEAGVSRRIHLIAPTAADCRDVLLEGPAGILSIAQPHMRPVYSSSLRKVEWPNGAMALLFSSDEPDRLRGPQCDTLWIDELCAMRSAQEVLDMAMLGLRLSKDPRCLITTTPRPIKCFKALVARDGQDVTITRCSTLANAENLARPFLSQILQQYQGTRLGRQELNAELLLDVPGALWTLQMLEETRVKEAPAQLQRIVIGVDPAGSSAEWADQTGIVVCALGMDNHVYILEDASGHYTPGQWADTVVELYHRHGADRICVERNFGGDLAEANIRTADPSVAIKSVTSSRGKVLRCEPISALWEQKRAHIVGSLPPLEDQLCNFSHSYDRSRDGSPDRLDAAVFALTELTQGAAAGRYFRSTSLLVNGEPVKMPRHVDNIFAIAAASESDAVAVLYFGSAKCVDENHPHPLVILDWVLAEAESAMRVEWLVDVLDRGGALAREVGRKGAYTAPLVVEPSPFASVMLEFAAQFGFPVKLLDRYDRMPPPDLLSRATAARGYVGTGVVKISGPAYSKTAPFRGVSRNHFASQIFAFDPEGNPNQEALEFIQPFCAGVIASRLDQPFPLAAPVTRADGSPAPFVFDPANPKIDYSVPFRVG